MLPRIPKVKDSWGFAKAGRKLSGLHLGYEEIEPWPPEEIVISEGDDLYHVVKMRYGGNARKPDKSTVVVNEHLTLAGIPEKAHEYMLGSRSAIEWILERYQMKTDKASGIVNDPNDWGWAPSLLAVRTERIEQKVAWFHGESDEVSGAPKILADLRDDGETISRKDVPAAVLVDFTELRSIAYFSYQVSQPMPSLSRSSLVL